MFSKSIVATAAFAAALSLLPEEVQAQFGGQNQGGRTDPVSIVLGVNTGIVRCYSLDGSNNNLQNAGWGAIGAELLRQEGRNYPDDDWNNMRTSPNPRIVSNVLSHETCASAAGSAEICLNDWYWLWGQMIDHDMTKVPAHNLHRGPAVVDEKDKGKELNMTLEIPANDPFLANQRLSLSRSKTNNRDEQFNIVSSFIDASHIYGSNIEEANRVRSFQNGMLLATSDGFMPVISARARTDFSDVPTFIELGSPSGRDQFLCADMRCNQHAPMASMQTMFLREHNRIARLLATANHPAYRTDESIYQAARALNIAMIQAITVNEFLPLTLGTFNLPTYTGYKPTVNPGIANAFATGAFRVPHTMIGCDFKEMTSGGQTLRSVPYATSFFDSTWIRGAPAQPNRGNREQNAYQTIMHALALNPSTRVDSKVAPSFRSVIFAPSTSPSGQRRPSVAFDLIASDIQRGRDHGLLNYNDMRVRMGWTRARSINDITRDAFKHRALSSVYTNVDEVDLMAGLLAEDTIVGGLFGPVTSSIIRDQFTRLRDGDRCWFQAQFAGPLLNAISNTRLRDLVDRNFSSNGRSSLFSSTEISSRLSPTDAEVFDQDVAAAAAASAASVTTFSLNDKESKDSKDGKDGKDSKDKKDKYKDKKDKKDKPAFNLREFLKDEAPIPPPSGPASMTEKSEGFAVPVREASILDDVIGYQCTETGCVALANDNDPDVSSHPEVLAAAVRVRETLRLENGVRNSNSNNNGRGVHSQVTEVAPGVFLTGQHNDVLRPETHRMPPQATMNFGHGVHTANTHHGRGQMNTFQFSTLGQANFDEPSIHQEAAFTFDQFGNIVIANQNGMTPFSREGQHQFHTQQFVAATPAGTNTPAPGINTNPARAHLATVNPAVLTDNIFVTPQCRR